MSSELRLGDPPLLLSTCVLDNWSSIWAPSAIRLYTTVKSKEDNTTWSKCFLLFCCSFWFWDRVSLCSSGWPQTPKCLAIIHHVPSCSVSKNNHTWRLLLTDFFPLSYNSKNSGNDRCIFTIHYTLCTCKVHNYIVHYHIIFTYSLHITSYLANTFNLMYWQFIDSCKSYYYPHFSDEERPK